MSDEVLLVGGPARSGAADPDAPRLDVDVIADALGARRSPTPPLSGARARLLAPLPGDFHHAWRVRRAPAAAFLTLSEGAGLPLAVLGPANGVHVMVAHNLTSTRRRLAQRVTRYLERIDRIVVLSRAQERFLRDEVGLPAERVRFVFDKVDHRFFAPQGRAGTGGHVLSVGAEARDYPTLLEAVRRLGDPPTVLVASSPWVGPAAVDGDLPPTVTVRRGVPFRELRDLYEGAAVVVVPLRGGTRYAAGVNAVLEAMAMARPLVVTETPGLDGYLDDGTTLRTVPPGDPAALADAVGALLADDAEARRLGANARAVVDGGRNLDRYVAEVGATVREALAGRDGARA